MSKEIEIGYVCRRDHYVFNGDEDDCGTKRVAGIFVRGEGDLPEEDLQEILNFSQSSLISKIQFWRANG